ncbi:hypothetical protein [Shinella zoogloeoides]|uniref:hypothetical protein n=1 Tax=Shinella zoogloeoides TaxID=352475 RepID=UPI00299ED0C9|nr:hypothetical protein [Shinella zoogloeoides]WPE24118.1 hypothetical protein ShzoTeo12_53380 [Shinella zoogloeoides]
MAGNRHGAVFLSGDPNCSMGDFPRADKDALSRGSRAAETGTLWKLTAWGDYFAYTPQRHWYQSIFLSSFPSAWCAGIIVLVGLFMRAKVEQAHHYLSAAEEGCRVCNEPQGADAALRAVLSSLQFFLKFPMHRYSASSGPASQPMSALELLIDSGAIVADKFKVPENDEEQTSPSRKKPTRTERQVNGQSIAALCERP